MKVKYLKQIETAIKNEIEASKSETKRDVYLFIKELEDSDMNDSEILRSVKAYLLGRKREEMLFDL